MDGRVLAGILIIFIVLASTLAVAPIAKGETEESGEKAKLSRLIEKIRRDLERLKNIASNLNDTEKRQEIEDKIGEAETLLAQAEQHLNSGEIEKAKEAIREVFSILREIAQLLGREKWFKGRLESARRYIRIVESLRKHLIYMERVADRLQNAGENVSEVRALIQLSRDYLSKSLEAARDKNFTAAREYLEKAKQAVKEAWEKLRALEEEFLSNKAPELLSRLKELFQRIESRLENISPELAEKFASWAQKKEQLIESLIDEGKYRRALVEIRKALGELRRFTQHLEGLRKLNRLLVFAQKIAERVRGCNSTLADMILQKVGQIRQAVKSKDWGAVRELSSELVSLLRNARSCKTISKKE